MNVYTQAVPDRYSINKGKYDKEVGFHNGMDITKWIQGNANNLFDINRFFFLNLCIDYLLQEGIRGHAAEVGVYKGNSAFLLAEYAKKVDAQCYLFDTFEGFDQKDCVGVDSIVPKSSFKDVRLDDVENLVGHNPVYIQGYFPDSIPYYMNGKKFSLVHLDCDLKKPTMAALEYFYPRIVKGGFLVMHDHSSYCWKGVEEAVNEFFKDKPEWVIPVPDKSGSCVIRKI